MRSSPVPGQGPGRLILAAGSLLDADPMTALAAAAGAGYDGVGLRLSDQHRPEPGRAAAIGARAAELGLRINDAEVHRITTPTTDPGPLIDAAVEVGAEHVLAVSDLADRAATATELHRFAERCRSVGIGPVLEYMAWTTPSDPVGAIDLATDSGCGIVVDLLHHVRVGAGPEELAAIVRTGLLAWVQLCDAPAAPPADLVREARHRRLTPGRGRLPLGPLLARLPPDTVISIEVQNDRLQDRFDPPERAAVLAAGARDLLGRTALGR